MFGPSHIHTDMGGALLGASRWGPAQKRCSNATAPQQLRVVVMVVLVAVVVLLMTMVMTTMASSTAGNRINKQSGNGTAASAHTKIPHTTHPTAADGVVVKLLRLTYAILAAICGCLRPKFRIVAAQDVPGWNHRAQVIAHRLQLDPAWMQDANLVIQNALLLQLPTCYRYSNEQQQRIFND
ncbi:hypothetical protein VOLCADRAFT_106315 [Volvox carteri f. nagariensis]|uniref:Uncharacterized protein n=1 Tax=Volvox carteri f. nagariensis TaxID=3068 RepID=D8U6I9_VOLCA|nr:uncharacterized protein VOLCADRAFT_106315 [Volvox carteri f. nagariensis]EFJ44655.1 hypothetical protein VOLCADRAFT_106315 [Volvox carteri f. nagariensis]|eukprot:XP_002954231.1 hypothetical protein VOLCADRAFT_106315 [Volvox carteri f. nagariensis]